MKKVIFTCGAPGSGKSTWTSEQIRDNCDTVALSMDGIRMSVFGYTEHTLFCFYTDPHLKEKVELVEKLFYDLLNVYLYNPAIKTIIVDNTNVEPKYIQKIIKEVRTRAKFEIKFFDYGIKDIKKLYDKLAQINSIRVKSVPTDVILKMLNSYFKNKNVLQSIIDDANSMYYPTIDNKSDKPDCIIFDIDGTLAHHGDRNPYNFGDVYQDTIDEKVVHLLKTYSETDVKIIVCSGRKEYSKEETIRWFKDKVNYCVEECDIYMRKDEDNRPDWIVKHELWYEITQKYHILYIVDDRNQVVDHARDIGLKVFQVEPGNF